MAFGSAMNSGHYDGNQNASLVVVAGTLGTSDIGGTANTMPLSGDPVTGAAYVEVLSGTTIISVVPSLTQSVFGTIGTTGATVFGTLAGGTSSGAGTEIFVTSISVTMPATAGSQDISVGFGTNGGTFHSGTGRLVRGMFPAGGGIQKQFIPAINSGTNAQLTYFQAGAGTAEIDITYFTIASTL